MSNRIRVELFGSLKLLFPDGTQLPVRGAKQQAILAILALSPGASTTRDQLIDLLWADRFADQARQSLRQAISKIRRLLKIDGVEAFWTDRDRLGLNLDRVDIDVLTFQQLNAEPGIASAEKAIALHNPKLVDGLVVAEAAFENWLSEQRRYKLHAAFPLYERLASHKLKSGQQTEAIEIARRLVSLDNLRESSHRFLMRLLAQSGQRSEAIQQYDECRRLLKLHLDVPPDELTTTILAEIKAAKTVASKFADDQDQSTPEPVPGPSASRIRLIVRPFQFTGESSVLPDFNSALVEDLTVALTQYRWLEVLAYQPFGKERRKGAAMFGRTMQSDLNYAIEGSVRQRGRDILITVQLIDFGSGKYISIHRFQEHADDLMSVLEKLSAAAAARIESELVANEGNRARACSEDTMGAWDCYHLGLATQYEFNAESNAKAQALFRRAIELDPSFSAAYSRLSYAIVLSTIYFEADPSNGLLDTALELAKTAARLDDHDAVARFALGRAYLVLGDYDRSVQELTQAIEMNKGFAQAYCGLGDALAYMGNLEDSIPLFEEATRLSPHDPHRWAFSMYGALALMFAERYDEAVIWARRAVRVANSHFWANAALVSALGHLGAEKEARAALAELRSMKPEFSADYVRARLFYLRDKTQVEHYIDGLRKAGLEGEPNLPEAVSF